MQSLRPARLPAQGVDEQACHVRNQRRGPWNLWTPSRLRAGTSRLSSPINCDLRQLTPMSLACNNSGSWEQHARRNVRRGTGALVRVEQVDRGKVRTLAAGRPSTSIEIRRLVANHDALARVGSSDAGNPVEGVVVLDARPDAEEQPQG